MSQLSMPITDSQLPVGSRIHCPIPGTEPNILSVLLVLTAELNSSVHKHLPLVCRLTVYTLIIFNLHTRLHLLHIRLLHLHHYGRCSWPKQGIAFCLPCCPGVFSKCIGVVIMIPSALYDHSCPICWRLAHDYILTFLPHNCVFQSCWVCMSLERSHM